MNDFFIMSNKNYIESIKRRITYLKDSIEEDNKEEILNAIEFYKEELKKLRSC